MRGRGLTRASALVYHALPCDTIGEIVARTGLSRRTVYSALRSLHSEGLTTQDETNAWVRLDESLDAVAKRRGTAGASEQQRRKHAYQRENFTAWLMQPQARKTKAVYLLRTQKEEEEQQPPDCVWWEAIEWKDAA
jgi:hypothetical protein